MYSSTLPSTSALDGGGWPTSRRGRFTPGKDPVPIIQEAGWAPGPVWTGAENLAPHRDSIPGPSSPQRVAIPTELSPTNKLKKYLTNESISQHYVLLYSDPFNIILLYFAQVFQMRFFPPRVSITTLYAFNFPAVRGSFPVRVVLLDLLNRILYVCAIQTTKSVVQYCPAVAQLQISSSSPNSQTSSAHIFTLL